MTRGCESEGLGIQWSWFRVGRAMRLGNLSMTDSFLLLIIITLINQRIKKWPSLPSLNILLPLFVRRYVSSVLNVECFKQPLQYQLILCYSTQMQNDQSTFDMVNNMLNADQQAIIQSQSFKIQQLRSLCGDLINTNKELSEQIELLKEQLEAKTTQSTQTFFNDEYSQMQLDFTDIQQNIKSYRAQLEKYQNHISLKLKEKNGVIDKLKDEVAVLQSRSEEQRGRVRELQSQRQALEQTKNTLLMQIEQLQSSIKMTKYQTPKSSRRDKQHPNLYHPQNASFNTNIQNQLQKLIEKLIKQLQYERNIKKKMNEQNKRLQSNVVQLEKEIVGKNNKIYQLELYTIKNHKQYMTKSTQGKQQPRKQLQYNRNNRQPSKLSKNMRNFTYMEVINDDIELTARQKLIIALKTIDLYIKKIENSDFSSQILQSIKICNFNPINPNLIMIRTVKGVSDLQQEYQQSQGEVVWNLAFVLDSLFNQSCDKEKEFGDLSKQRDIIDFLNQILQSRQGNDFNTVMQLRKMVEQGVNLRK